ncbi:MAG: hypothetical protein HFE86_07665 [Clostridiales bacterium]|nr:hypothetical protein [Clostridiales bacterium]
MKKGFLKKFLSAALSAAMLTTVTPAMLAGAEDGAVENVLGLTWLDGDSWVSGTLPEWARNATDEEKQATIDAINREYLRQAEAGYDLGEGEGDNNGLSSYSDMVIVQFKGGDNVTSPWDANRKWGAIIAPFPGMAFSITGKMAARWDYRLPIGNAVEWTDPGNGQTNTWQMFYNTETFIGAGSANGTNWGFAPGSTLKNNDLVEAMVKAYAQSAYYNADFKRPHNLGLLQDNAKIDAATGIVYQEFFGNDSTGTAPNRKDTEQHKWGVSYMVAPSADASEVFIVTDKIMTAWGTTWNGADRFSVTGAPVANQVTDEEGNVSQLFEKARITVAADGAVTIQSTDNSLQNFAIEGGVTFADGNDITVVMETGTDVTKLTTSFDIDEKATVTPEAGETDFTNPVTYTVTAENGDQATYTVTVQVAPAEPAAADKEAAEKVAAAIEALPAEDQLYLNDRAEVQAARAAYEALTPMQRYLVTGLDKLDDAEKAIAALEANPLRVTMVGDSITEGVGATVTSKNYVSQTQKLLGSEFTVFNAGVSGKTLMSTPEAYTSTGRYTEGKNFAPDVVTIMLGTNDGKDRYWGLGSADQYNAAQFERELTELINVYRALPSKPVVMVATSPTVYGKRVDTIDDAYVSQIIQVQKKVAADMGCPVIDINAYTKEHENWFTDGVHPNDTGHTEMSKEFAKAVAQVNKAALSSIQVGDETIALEEGVYDYTVKVSADDELPAVTALGANGAQVTVEQDGEGELPLNVTITVISKNGNYKSVYTLTLEVGEDIVPGDMDGNGAVNIQDVMEACKVLARQSAGKAPTEDEMKRGDLDGDGKVTITDVMEICKILARQA